MAGYPCQMEEIQSICNNHNIILIEDWLTQLERNTMKIMLGNLVFLGNFSFYPTKQITTGEGGIVISDDKVLLKGLKN